MKKMLILMVLLGFTACSNKAVYDNLRKHQRDECFKQPPAQREECLDRTDKSYEDYQRERKEVLDL